jgi:short-subunit dehydrogenase
MTIIVTGASSGIGFELSKRYLEKGHTLYLLARQTQALEGLKQIYQNCHICQVDITDFEELQKVTAKICKEEPCIDIVIANAGISAGHSSEIMPFLEFKRIIDTNFISVHALFEEIIGKMIVQKSGKLVAISSLASLVAMPTTLAYSSSKRALNSYMESLRLAVKAYKIDVVNIQPGFIKTTMTDKNSFKMPFLMELKEGVDEIMYAIEKSKDTHAFPFVFASFVKFLAFIPSWIRDTIILKLASRAYGKR